MHPTVLIQAVAEQPAPYQRVPISPPARYLGRIASSQPVPVQVLPDVAGAVASPLHPDREALPIVESLGPALRPIVAEDAVIVRVLTGEEGRPRGAAERKRRIEV